MIYASPPLETFLRVPMDSSSFRVLTRRPGEDKTIVVSPGKPAKSNLLNTGIFDTKRFTESLDKRQHTMERGSTCVQRSSSDLLTTSLNV